MEYHKRASEILGELVPVINSIQAEQEESYRKGRDLS
jgi:hypothetical protein